MQNHLKFGRSRYIDHNYWLDYNNSWFWYNPYLYYYYPAYYWYNYYLSPYYTGIYYNPYRFYGSSRTQNNNSQLSEINPTKNSFDMGELDVDGLINSILNILGISFNEEEKITFINFLNLFQKKFNNAELPSDMMSDIFVRRNEWLNNYSQNIPNPMSLLNGMKFSNTSKLNNNTSKLNNNTSKLNNNTSKLNNNTSVLNNNTSVLNNNTSVLNNNTSVLKGMNFFKFKSA
jgi:X-X-X-Leu-X-X-Gly heptad repeat protein